MIKSHEIKNVTDFNVADSVRRDIKVLITKTRYIVNDFKVCKSQISWRREFHIPIAKEKRNSNTHQSLQMAVCIWSLGFECGSN